MFAIYTSQQVLIRDSEIPPTISSLSPPLQENHLTFLYYSFSFLFELLYFTFVQAPYIIALEDSKKYLFCHLSVYSYHITLTLSTILLLSEINKDDSSETENPYNPGHKLLPSM